MKIAIIDDTPARGNALLLCIKKHFKESEIITILGPDASGPRALRYIQSVEGNFGYIFVHHAQFELAQSLSQSATIIRYTAFYNNEAAKFGGVWLEQHVSELDGVSDEVILKAISDNEQASLPPEPVSVLESQQSEAGLQSQARVKMPHSRLGLWHALASHDLSEEERDSIKRDLVEQHGDDAKVEKFAQLFEQSPNEAFEFVQNIMAGMKNEGSKHDQGLRYEQSDSYHKRNFKILLVDDNEHNFGILKAKLQAYLLDNDEPFEADVVLHKTLDDLKSKFLQLQNLQAVIFDDCFPGDANVYEIISELNLIRPNIPFYISGAKVVDTSADYAPQDSLIFLPNVRAYEFKDDKRATALFDVLMEDLKDRIDTPYFTALNKYATERKSAFHALPITDGGSLNNSVWTREFTDFYQRKFFSAETSNTKAPLSSVFSPQGALEKALDKAKKAFGSDKTLFTTSGTTVSNLLVYKIHIRQGDVVLLDWNCHKSHHNAMVECGARVKYLQSDYNPAFAMAGLVSKDTILTQLQLLKDNNEPVKMISLTHPSFDGMLYDVEEIMRAANKIFPGIIFFFDEAWFAYGAFYPDLEIRQRAAMLAANNIRQENLKETGLGKFPENDVRVYVTHSVHKTLSAIRQGSMLHIHDPYLVYGNEEDRLHLEYMIDNAYETYITTSPNNSILASLDVARMQAEIEGYDRIKYAIGCVEFFKRSLRAMTTHSMAAKQLGLRVIEPQELTPNSSTDQVLVDPLKVTLAFDIIPGAKAVKDLNNHKIQINKYSANTVLLLFSIGVTRGNVNHLLHSLHAWAEKVMATAPGIQGQDVDKDMPEIPKFHPDFTGDSRLQVACMKKAYDEFHASRLPDDNREGFRLFTKATTRSITECLELLAKGEQLVAAQALTPYPPGSPVIVAGQLLEGEILKSLVKLQRTGGEIHGVVKNPAGEDSIIVANYGKRVV